MHTWAMMMMICKAPLRVRKEGRRHAREREREREREGEGERRREEVHAIIAPLGGYIWRPPPMSSRT